MGQSTCAENGEAAGVKQRSISAEFWHYGAWIAHSLSK